jgi:hypothetical protein
MNKIPKIITILVIAAAIYILLRHRTKFHIIPPTFLSPSLGHAQISRAVPSCNLRCKIMTTGNSCAIPLAADYVLCGLHYIPSVSAITARTPRVVPICSQAECTGAPVTSFAHSAAQCDSVPSGNCAIICGLCCLESCSTPLETTSTGCGAIPGCGCNP